MSRTEDEQFLVILSQCPMCSRPMTCTYKTKEIENSEKSSKFWSWREKVCTDCGYVISTEPTIVETSWS